MKSVLQNRCVGVAIIPGTNDIWCRDFMPVQVRDDRFIQFAYHPSYFRNYPNLITPSEIGRAVLPPWRCEDSSIVLDGGNLVHFRDTAIMTDKIFAENPHCEREELVQELESLPQLNRIILIPVEPGDIFGHADGVVLFVDEQTVVVNDYSDASRSYQDPLLSIIREHGLEVIEIPYSPNLKSKAKIPPATRGYVKVLHVDGLLLVPAYCLPTDVAACQTLAEAYGIETVPIDCRAVAKEGGALNCITWNVRLADA